MFNRFLDNHHESLNAYSTRYHRILYQQKTNGCWMLTIQMSLDIEEWEWSFKWLKQNSVNMSVLSSFSIKSGFIAKENLTFHLLVQSSLKKNQPLQPNHLFMGILSFKAYIIPNPPRKLIQSDIYGPLFVGEEFRERFPQLLFYQWR